MADEEKLLRQTSRGERARRILDDDLVKEAFEKIEAGILVAFKTSAIDDDRGRRHAREALGILQNFREQFSRAVTTGDAAGKELLRIQEESKLKRLMHGRR